MRIGRLHVSHWIIALAFALSAGALPGWVPAAVAQDDATRFAALLAARAETASMAGPFEGEIVQELGVSMTAGAGLVTEDFSARVTFANPVGGGGASWDYGFMFHEQSSAAQCITVDSDGSWYYLPYPDGTLTSGFAPGLDVSAGGTNTLDLVVAESIALFGVIGAFVARIRSAAGRRFGCVDCERLLHGNDANRPRDRLH